MSDVFQEPYEIIGDSATNEDHYGPTKARLSDSLLLRHFEICCVGTFHHLSLGMWTVLYLYMFIFSGLIMVLKVSVANLQEVDVLTSCTAVFEGMDMSTWKVRLYFPGASKQW